jgi:DNA-binding MarR family transcriptional regulator
VQPDRDEVARRAWTSLSAVFFGDELHDRFHDAAQAARLPHPGALKALMGLDPDQPRSMRAMAEDLRCDASYVTALVDALEALGYVERRQSPADRRVKLVHLTAAGLAARDTAHAVMSTPPTVLDRLTDADVRALARIVAKLED